MTYVCEFRWPDVCGAMHFHSAIALISVVRHSDLKSCLVFWN